MPTTSNFGWTTPADTDLVKDGAAAIRTLGNGVDSSFVDLKGGTTDQVLAKNSNTDLDFKWVTSDDANAIQNAIVDAKGDIIAATAADTPARLPVGTNDQRLVAASGEATGLKYVSDTQNTVVDAKGDLIVGTAADTVARLAVGTNGYTLVADSAETTGLKWAAPAVDTNGFVYLTGTTFTSVSSFSLPTNTFTSSYKNYKIFVYWTGYTTASDLTIRARTAGTDYTGSQYFYGTARQPYSISYAATTGSAVSAWKIGLNDYYDRSAVEFTYYDPKGSGDRLTFTGMVDNIGGAFGGLYQNGTSNVDSLTFAKASGNMSGFYRVYGLKDS